MIASLAKICFLTVLCSATAAAHGDLFVDANSATCLLGTGSVGNPVCTVEAAINLAVPGDTVHIAPGIYAENLSILFDLNLVGTSGSDVTVIDGGGFGDVVMILNAAAVSIDGLTLRNGLGTGVRVFGALTLSNSTITGNHTLPNDCGGGLVCESGAFALLEACRVTNNVAHGGNLGAARGGGICSFGDLAIHGSTISDNHTMDAPNCGGLFGGGGISATGDSFLMENSTISGNTSDCDGGGLFLDTSTRAVIRNCTISYNTSINGGGGCTGGILGQIEFESVTITKNRSRFFAAGASMGGGGFAHNSVIAGNLKESGAPAIDVQGIFNSLGSNVIGAPGHVNGTGFTDGVLGDRVGTFASPIDPLLSPLGDHGGPTQTHMPIFGSPCIEAGDALAFELFDQRGVARPIGPAPDIGSVEFDSSLSSFCNGDGGNQFGCTACPCGNDAAVGFIGGCINRLGNGARLGAGGSPSVSLPVMSDLDLRFELTGVPPQTFAILVSGSALAPGNPQNPCFGLGSGVRSVSFDGLRCAVMNLRRHGGRAADGNGEVGVANSPWGGEAGPNKGLSESFGAGETRYFQAIYREDPLAVCSRGLNTSQAIEVEFTP